MFRDAQPWQDALLSAVRAERDQLRSRRAVLAGTAGLALGAGVIALPAAAQEATPGAGTATAPELNGAELSGAFTDDLDVLNYALTLEHLENAFYRDGLASFTLDQFTTAGFDPVVIDNLTAFGNQELAHVEALTAAVTSLGGTPAQEGVYDFGDAFTDPLAFLETAQALENVGVGAYDGAGAAISDPALLTTAGTIVAVEALHAAYLNVLNGDLPAPSPFEEPLSRDEVLEIASQFIASDTATPAAG